MMRRTVLDVGFVLVISIAAGAIAAVGAVVLLLLGGTYEERE